MRCSAHESVDITCPLPLPHTLRSAPYTYSSPAMMRIIITQVSCMVRKTGRDGEAYWLRSGHTAGLDEEAINMRYVT